jgi:hypothetical protein
MLASLSSAWTRAARMGEPGAGQAIGIRRKALVVEQQRWRHGGVDGRLRRHPMPRDHQDGAWRLGEAAGEVTQIELERLPGLAHGARLQEEAGPAPVVDEERRLHGIEFERHAGFTGSD